MVDTSRAHGRGQRTDAAARAPAPSTTTRPARPSTSARAAPARSPLKATASDDAVRHRPASPSRPSPGHRLDRLPGGNDTYQPVLLAHRLRLDGRRHRSRSSETARPRRTAPACQRPRHGHDHRRRRPPRPASPSISPAAPGTRPPSVPLTLEHRQRHRLRHRRSSGVVERAEATLTNGSCGTFGGLDGGDARPAAPTPPSTSGTCYRYRFTISDQVGNTSDAVTASTAARIDTTAPTVRRALTLSPERRPVLRRRRHDPLLQPAGSNTGSFAVTATAADAQSGIQKLAFPAVSGTDWTARRQRHHQPVRLTTYTWDDTRTATGTQTVTATNGAGSDRHRHLHLTADDTTAPTGQTVELAGGPWYTTISVPLTLDAAPTPAPASTPRAASSSAPRPRSPTAAAAPSARGRRSPSPAAPTPPSRAAPATATASPITDHVGNTSAPSSASADAKIDTTAADRADA